MRYVGIGCDILASPFPFPRTTSTLMFVSDKLRRPRMRHPAESASVFFRLFPYSSVCAFFEQLFNNLILFFLSVDLVEYDGREGC